MVYTIEPISPAGCIGDPFTMTATINPEPVGIPDALTVCSDEVLAYNIQTDGTAVAATTYNISVNSNGLTFTGTSASGGSGKLVDELADDSWTNSSLIPVNVIYTITPVSATGCQGNSFAVTITVNPEPVGITETVATCSDVAVSGYNIKSQGLATPAANFNISVNPNGLTQSGGTDSNGNAKSSNELADDEWNNITLAPVDVIYTIIPVSTLGCEGDPFDVTFTIYPEPVGTDDNLSICSAAPLAYDLQNNVDVTGNAMPSIFSWYATDNPNITGESTVPQNTATINDILVNTTNSTQACGYRWHWLPGQFLYCHHKCRSGTAWCE